MTDGVAGELAALMGTEKHVVYQTGVLPTPAGTFRFVYYLFVKGDRHCAAGVSTLSGDGGTASQLWTAGGGGRALWCHSGELLGSGIPGEGVFEFFAGGWECLYGGDGLQPPYVFVD